MSRAQSEGVQLPTWRKLLISGIGVGVVTLIVGVGLAGGQSESPGPPETLTLETLQSQMDMLTQRQEALLAESSEASDPARIAEINQELDSVAEERALRIAQYWGLRQGEDPSVVANYKVGRTPDEAWPEFRPGAAQEPPRDLLGGDLAEALGLELKRGYIEGCDHFVEVEEGAGYCYEDFVESDYQAWQIGYRLQGRLPTDLERQIFLLDQQVMASTDPNERQQLVQQLEELLARL
jgi:hypothetical protein